MPEQKVATRLEHDVIGERTLPAEAYYGVQTLRGLGNFHISGVPLSHYPEFVEALAIVKLAAPRANHECGQFSKEIAGTIEGACQVSTGHVAGRRGHRKQVQAMFNTY